MAEHRYERRLNIVVDRTGNVSTILARPWRIQMNQKLSALASILSSAALGARRFLANSSRTRPAAEVRTYRPERHYMRGPGPKWREKYAQVSTRR